MFDPEDDLQYEPLLPDEIDEVAEFSVAIMEQADNDNILFEMITEWEPERVFAYQQAFLMYNIAQHMHDHLTKKPETDRFDI